jgi:hypothetical protein
VPYFLKGQSPVAVYHLTAAGLVASLASDVFRGLVGPWPEWFAAACVWLVHVGQDHRWRSVFHTPWQGTIGKPRLLSWAVTRCATPPVHARPTRSTCWRPNGYISPSNDINVYQSDVYSARNPTTNGGLLSIRGGLCAGQTPARLCGHDAKNGGPRVPLSGSCLLPRPQIPSPSTLSMCSYLNT